ncbi:MAG: chemotaxis protein CheW [Legionella sp.]
MSKEQKHASELMPKDEDALLVLQARAKHLAQQEMDASKNNGIAFIRFKLTQNENYGIPYQYVQEILHNATMSRPPFVPNFISGVINWRGNLITVVDLIKFFHPNHAKHATHYDHEFIIVINANDVTLGLLTQRVEGNEVYQPHQLATPLSTANVANPEYILGLYQATTAIINVETLIVSLSQEIKKSLYRIGELHGN